MKLSQARSGSIECHLEQAATAARGALERSFPQGTALLETLSKYDAAVRVAEIRGVTGASPNVAPLLESYQARFAELRDTLDDLVVRAAKSIRHGLSDLQRDVDFVTIMLFGRTRAGKSTTMEALTGGDGSSIGVGRQHTTKDVRAYYFPPQPGGSDPSGPALRIVDTPGIEGFEGGALAVMAEEFVERSDHILFLLSDDKATADELDRFGLIRTQGKGVTVLLNVKSRDEDLDLLLTHPDLVFRQSELDGHARRVTGYLERKFGIAAPRLLTLHSRAAWLARRKADLPEGVADRALLERNSRVPDLEQHIAGFIRDEAVPARVCAPRDMLLGYLVSLKEELRPFAGRFRGMSNEIERLASRLEAGAKRARARARERIPLLSSRFEAASDAVPALVDKVIAAKARGAELDKQWRVLLKESGVTEAGQWFTSVGKRDFEDELSEELHAMVFDHDFAAADDLDHLLSSYHEEKDKLTNNKFVKAGVRTAGGSAAGALATWGVANFWNPTGWLAIAGAAVATAVVAFGGSEAARMVTDGWERKSSVEMATRRDVIIRRLRDRIWGDHGKVKTGCSRWLDQIVSSYVQTVNDVARPVSDSSARIWQTTVNCLDELDRLAALIHLDLITDLLNALVPECSAGAVTVVGVAREPGYRTKIRIRGSERLCSNPIGACVGKEGSRIGRLRRALDNELIDLIDADASLEAQVAQALGLGRKPAQISFLAGDSTAYVLLPERVSERSVIGPRGANVRLAKQLCGFDIHLHGTEK